MKILSAASERRKPSCDIRVVEDWEQAASKSRFTIVNIRHSWHQREDLSDFINFNYLLLIMKRLKFKKRDAEFLIPKTLCRSAATAKSWTTSGLKLTTLRPASSQQNEVALDSDFVCSLYLPVSQDLSKGRSKVCMSIYESPTWSPRTKYNDSLSADPWSGVR